MIFLRADDGLELNFNLAEFEFVILVKGEFLIGIDNSPYLIMKIKFLEALKNYFVILLCFDVEYRFTDFILVLVVDVHDAILVTVGYLRRELQHLFTFLPLIRLEVE